MKEKLFLCLQIAAVFVGTIVGAGLASGQEITQFFTSYGYKSFWGIIICCLIYIFIGRMIIVLSIKYKLNSYGTLIKLVSPNFLGEITDILMGLFLLCSSAIILAGSGALFHQYFGISKWIGILVMAFLSLLILMRDTSGLMEINSFIVPSLIIVICTIFILFICFSKDSLTINFILSVPIQKNHYLFSSLLYAGFNILCCSGVLVPLSSEINKKKELIIGMSLGAVILTIISSIINLMLLCNIPYIYKYEIPLLYIAHRFGKIFQIMLIAIIWCEMFSTEVSDIYSIAKTFQLKFKLSYKKSVLLILILALPISQFGFVNLIQYLYPAFGLVSLLFIVQCTIFYFKKAK